MFSDTHSGAAKWSRKHRIQWQYFYLLLGLALFTTGPSAAASLSRTIERVKPSIVGVGTSVVTRRPPSLLKATGFAVADGLHILTNAHVIPKSLDSKRNEALTVFIPTESGVERRIAKLVTSDETHDVALLQISGRRLPALRIGSDRSVKEGQAVAFTGFPSATVLGLHPVTHRGIVSAITPIVKPFVSPRTLDVATIKKLRDPYSIFQLDATAYPGNSGSPVYDPKTGKVYGIVNSVFVKGSKERVLKDPSGITYAIPIRHGVALLRKVGLKP